MKAETGELELIALDSLYLRTKQLNNLIKRLQRPNASNAVMTISLAYNNLTDDACKSLLDAVTEPTFCPSLLSINVRSNPRITQIGHQCLENITKLRKDVQVRLVTLVVGSTRLAFPWLAFPPSPGRPFLGSGVSGAVSGGFSTNACSNA